MDSSVWWWVSSTKEGERAMNSSLFFVSIINPTWRKVVFFRFHSPREFSFIGFSLRCAPRKALSPAISLSETPREENPLDQQTIEHGAHQSKLLPAKLSTISREKVVDGKEKSEKSSSERRINENKGILKGAISAQDECRRRPGSLLSASTKLPSLRHRTNEFSKVSKRKIFVFRRALFSFAFPPSRRLISINVYFIFEHPRERRRSVDTEKYFSRKKLKIILKRKLC